MFESCNKSKLLTGLLNKIIIYYRVTIYNISNYNNKISDLEGIIDPFSVLAIDAQIIDCMVLSFNTLRKLRTIIRKKSRFLF